MSKLTQEELVRYSRHLVLENFGLLNQEKLKASRVLVIGAGGLGCPALLYLAAVGIGTIGIVDFDTVARSNLQRQILFSIDDLGNNKALAARQRLHKLNPLINLHTYPERLTTNNVMEIAKNYDVILDGTDNFQTRYLINDACVLLNKPFVYASILKFEGQISSFNILLPSGGYSANYRDLFPEPPDVSAVPNCEHAGVLGVLPGMIGSMQALESIKLITGVGEPLINKLLLFDSLTLQQTIIGIRSNGARNGITRLIDYDEFCGINEKKNKPLEAKQKSMKEVTVQELKALKDRGADFQLIDVREPHEYDICHLDGQLIPQGEIPASVDKISKDKQVIIHCRSGARSGNMVQWLEKNHGFTNLYNLKGGILAWAHEIDPDMPTY